MTDRKAEIQGLRAIAVSSVLLFHVWPAALPGGFVGVDVFFVISGYLITGLLFREASTTGKISLLSFYERRIRRLLPAATFVLLAVAACLPLLPQARWEDTAYEIAASALYVENWRLAWLAVDYLGAENEPSPVQHYWSLSIEEQFYIVWPLVMVAVLAFLRRPNNLRGSLIFAMSAIFAASLLASITLTETDQAAAYFVSHTRVWELALGGLLAMVALPALPNAIRETMRVAGLAAIAYACLAFQPEMQFPGAAALIPTIGCALVIAAGRSDSRSSLYRALATAPAQRLGDMSYSVYLWHWPLVVFVSVYLSQPELSGAAGGLVVAATLVLAAFSKRFIEDPFRHPGATPVRAILSGATSVAAVVAAGALILVTVENPAPNAVAASASPTVSSESSAVTAIEDGLQPPLVKVARDLPDAYSSGCHRGSKVDTLQPCTFGPENAKFRVVLSGDSHAANWIPALQQLAAARGWRIETHTKSSCQLLVEVVNRKGKPYQTCYDWGQRVLKRIAEMRPDVVLVSQSSGARLLDPARPMEEAIAATWRTILNSGIQVVGIAETPWHKVNPVECVEKDRACASDRSVAIRAVDPLRNAVRLEPRVPLLDMNDQLCTPTSCPIVIDNVVVWRDRHHLTATFARTLADTLGDRLMSALTTSSTASIQK